MIAHSIVNKLMKLFCKCFIVVAFQFRMNTMKPFTRDIVLTIAIKLILLFLLWWFCVRGMHPDLSKSQEWLLGKSRQPAVSQIHKEVIS